MSTKKYHNVKFFRIGMEKEYLLIKLMARILLANDVLRIFREGSWPGWLTNYNPFVILCIDN